MSVTAAAVRVLAAPLRGAGRVGDARRARLAHSLLAKAFVLPGMLDRRTVIVSWHELSLLPPDRTRRPAPGKTCITPARTKRASRSAPYSDADPGSSTDSESVSSAEAIRPRAAAGHPAARTAETPAAASGVPARRWTGSSSRLLRPAACRPGLPGFRRSSRPRGE